MARRQYRQSRKDGTAFDHEAASLLTTQSINISEIELLSFSPGHPETPEVTAEGTDLSPNIPVKSAGETAGAGKKGRINVTDNSALGLPRAEIRVVCSKGTYIRALARDIGEALDSGAHLDSLRRTRSGIFHIENAVSITEATALLLKGQES